MSKNSNKNILYDFIEELSSPVFIVNCDNVITYSNKTMIANFGNLLGESIDIVYGNGNEDSSEVDAGVIRRKISRKQYIGEALYNITSYPVDIDGKEYLVELLRDITEEMKTQAQLKNNYNKILKETKFAKSIQYSVLPISDDYWNMISLSAEYFPADDLSGDMYDIIKLNDNELLLYMADVSGHGIRAALLTIFLREVVRGIAHIATNEGLDKLLEALLKNYSALDIDSEMYFSILVCKYNKSSQELSIANAGHNCFPIILRKNGRIEEVPVKGMPITSIGFSPGYDEETIGIYSGDRILLYTDGIIEEYSESKGTEFGVIGLRNVVSNNFDLSAKELVRKVIQEAEKHSKTKAKDDRTILAATIL